MDNDFGEMKIEYFPKKHGIHFLGTGYRKLLMEENDRLQEQVSQLVYESGYVKQQLQNVSASI